MTVTPPRWLNCWQLNRGERGLAGQPLITWFMSRSASLLTSDRVRVVPTEPGPASDDPWDTATVVLAELTERERLIMCEHAPHMSGKF